MDMTAPAQGVAELFAHSVSATPDRLACMDSSERVTYRRLDEWGSAVAAALDEQLPARPSPVAILAENDVAAVAAIVGAVKAGRAFVMLDPTTPPERLQQMCESAGPAMTVVGNGLRELAESIGPSAGILLDMPLPGLISTAAPAVATSRKQVFTIFFTSGSMGHPKGVVARSTAFAESIMAWDTMGGDGETIGCTAPLSFTFGLLIAMRSLLTSSTLLLYDARTRGVGTMPAWIRDNRITVIGMTPYLSRQLVAASLDQEVPLNTLIAVTVGGEPVLPSDVSSIRAATGDACIIYNQFASSETWFMTRLPMDRNYILPPAGPLPAGFSAPGRDVYLIGEDGARVSEPGVPGVIHVAGTSLASGYWHDPELTATKFTTLDDGRTIVNTGDIGRWTERGELVPLGRADNMLKIRGYLVEPAEVEGHLRAIDGIADCVVVGLRSPTDPGTTILVAYLAAGPQGAPTVPSIRRRLVTQLPSYMVPIQYVVLTELPRNPNGKVDRTALPTPQLPSLRESELEEHFQRPVAAICARALEVERLGADDDIFALGADSLAIAEICAALEEEFDIKVDSAAVLKNPTVAQLAAMLRAGTAGELVDGVMVALAEAAGGTPLFVFAGAAGLAVEFRHLAREIRANRSMYALQSYGLEGRGMPDLTIGQVVRRYVRAIRRIQPTGPYAIAGHSAGAVLACAVADHLVGEGERVAYVGLFDPLGDELLKRGYLRPDAGSYTGIPQRLNDVRSLRTLREWAYFRRPWLTRSYWRDVRGGGRGRIWGDLASKMAHAYRPPRGGLDVSSAVVYVVEGNEEPVTGGPGWFAGDRTEAVVSGDHWTMLRPPFVRDLAARVQTDISASLSRRDG